MCGRRVSGTGMLISVATRVPEARTAPSEQRHQELLAAWATGQPLACPKCHGTLHKAGVALFLCRSCGEKVQLEVTPPVTGPAAAGPATSPASNAGR